MESILHERKEVITEILQIITNLNEKNYESASKSFEKISPSCLNLLRVAISEESPDKNFPDWVNKLISALKSEDRSENASLEYPSQNQIEQLLDSSQSLLESEVHKILELYNDDKLAEATSSLSLLRQRYERNFEEISIFSELEADFSEILNVFKMIEENEGWTKECSGHINVKYKNVKGTPTYSLLTDAVLEVPVLNFLTLVYEADLYPNWVPFCKRAYTVGKVSRSRKVLVQEFDVKYISKRHTLLYGYGANLLSTHGAVVVYSKSCDQSDAFKGISLPKINTTRAHVNTIAFVLRPLTPTTMHATMLTNYDPNLYYVPYKILNFFSRKMAKGLFQKLEKLAKNFEGSEYQKRINDPENQEFYEHLRNSESNFLKENGFIELNK